MKYKVGDRVRIKSLYWYMKNKDVYGYIKCGKFLMNFEKSQLCDKIVTISRIDDVTKTYRIEEDNGFYLWTDEMIECKVEEGTKPKYEDEVNGEYYSTPKYLVRPSGYQFKDENGNIINAQKIVLEKLVVPKFKKGDKIKDKNNRVWYVVQVGNRHFDISRIPNPKGEGTGYFVPIEDQDYYELVPDIELPKTFEECVSVLMREGGNRMSLEQMNTFRKLIDARNAYWTIYGKENGLEKPWEPDYKNEYQKKYCLYNNKGDITKSVLYIANAILSFPTEEMRDTFYENFKSEIESCKEFL